MTWQCECGALTDSPDTRSLPHAPRCRIFDGKPVTIVSVYRSPETIENMRVRKGLAIVVGALERIAVGAGISVTHNGRTVDLGQAAVDALAEIREGECKHDGAARARKAIGR